MTLTCTNISTAIQAADAQTPMITPKLPAQTILNAQTILLLLLSARFPCYHVQAIRTWYPAGSWCRALPFIPSSAWALAPISELPRSQLIPPGV